MGESCEGVVATPLTRKHFLLDDNQCEGDSDSKVYLIYFPLLFFFLKPFKCGLVLHDFCWFFFSLRKDLCNLLLRVHQEWMRDKQGLQRIFSEQFSCQGYTSALVKLKLEVACLTVHMFILIA